MSSVSSSFRVDGLISGLKTTDIVSALMAVERRPLLNLQRQKALEQDRQAAWAAIKSRVSSLQSAVQKLSLRSTISAKSATTDTPSTTASILTATAGPDAAIGSFTVTVKQLADQSKATSNAYVGAAVAAATRLSTAGFATRVDTSLSSDAPRYFTVNGQRIEVGQAYQNTGAANSLLEGAALTTGTTVTVSDVQVAAAEGGDAYTLSGSGTSLTLTRTSDGAAQTITVADLATGSTEDLDFDTLGVKITLSNSSGSTKAAADIVTDATSATNNTIGTSWTTLNKVIADLQAALPGWTIGLVADAQGRAANALQITAPVGTTIQLGAPNDTSNFLSAVNLLNATASGAPEVLTSTRGIGGTISGEAIGSDGSGANLATALAGLVADQGSFTINGVSISYSATDTLNTIISRINSSNAGVLASLDPQTDRLRLTNVTTGPRQVVLEDVTGNLLQAMNLIDASDNLLSGVLTLGKNATYSIDSGADQYSESNTVTNAKPGVSLSLVRADPLTDVTVTIGQNTDTPRTALTDFIAAFNAVLDTVERYTVYDTETKQGSALTGDSAANGLVSQLRSLVSSKALGVSGKYQSLADIGVTTGKIGSAVGTAGKRLELDGTKLTTALADNPQAVETMVAGFLNSTSSTFGGTAAGNFTAIKGAPTTYYEDGTFTVDMQDTTGTAEVYFTNSSGQQYTKSDITFAANAVNTIAVPGVTLTAKAGAFTVGTTTFTHTVTQRGAMVNLKWQLNNQLSSTGLFASRDENSTDEISDLDQRISDMEDRLAAKEESLYRRFAAMEAALSRSQTQSAALASALAQLDSSSS